MRRAMMHSLIQLQNWILLGMVQHNFWNIRTGALKYDIVDLSCKDTADGPKVFYMRI